MSDLPLLYTFRRCPYAMRGRMALVYAGINCEVREVDLKNKTQALLNISSKGTVPVLQTQDGLILDESLDLMYWALEQNDPKGWNQLTTSERELTTDLANKNDTEFAKHNYRYKYFEKFPEKSQSDYRADCEPYLNALELRLSQTQFLVKDTLSLADIALFPFIRQFSKVDEKWYENSPYTKIKNWVNHIAEQNFFTKAMTKFDVWQDGNSPVTLF